VSAGVWKGTGTFRPLHTGTILPALGDLIRVSYQHSLQQRVSAQNVGSSLMGLKNMTQQVHCEAESQKKF
jgi:hypothetical protein